jgi:flagellin-like protein
MKFVKGISPVIATIILVLIAVVAGVLLWLWTSGFTSALPAQQQALYERIKIEGVKVNKTQDKVNVTAYVRNVGSVNVNISTVYILKPDGTIVEYSKLGTPITISPGEVEEVTVSVTLRYYYTAGYVYTIKVVTANGAEAAYTFVWPAYIG